MGFLFLVLYPLLLPSSLLNTHSLTHSHTHTHTHTHTLTHSHTHSCAFCVVGSACSAAFAWQAWDNVSSQGLGCTPWRPLGLRRFAWQAWDNVSSQGVGCTPWRPLGLRRFCVAGVGQCALPRGWMYALASLGAPPLLRGRRGTMCTAKGLDVRPGVPWGSASFAWDNVHC